MDKIKVEIVLDSPLEAKMLSEGFLLLSEQYHDSGAKDSLYKEILFRRLWNQVYKYTLEQ